ncbi:hypothetical protein ACFLSE_07915 [Bacteroidota bacterium]
MPADAAQSVFPIVTDVFLISVCSTKASVVSATSQKTSSPCVPIASINTSLLNNPKASLPL